VTPGQERAESDRRNHALGTLTAKLSQAGSLAEIACAIVSHGAPALGAGHCWVRLLGFAPGAAVTMAATDDAPSFVTEDLLLAHPRSPMRRAEHANQRVLIEDVHHTDHPAAEMTGFDGLAAVACLPLQAHSLGSGSVSVGYDTPRRFGPVDDALFTAFAELCTTAIERLRLATREHQISHELQVAMLGTIDRIDQLDIHTEYLAAEAGMEIGGDFYDAIALRHGRIGLVVGDVVGQGLAAATAMGQLRSMFRGAAMCIDDPAELIGLADHFARHIQGAYLCTMSYVVIDPSNERLTYATAGHPPPLLVRADGTAEWLDGARTTPLGFSASSVASASTDMRPGDTILLYTDGLIERRTEPLDVGLQRLFDTACAHRELPPEQLAHALIHESLHASAQRDDVALLIGQLAPVRTSRAFTPGRHRLETVSAGSSAPAERVLVVEDSDDLVELIDIALSGPWEVVAVHDAAAALHLLNSIEVDLVIADSSMTSNGATLTESIRATPAIASTPVILMSGMGSTAPTGLADAVLAKPFAIERLRDMVANLLIRVQR
jgi:CheY-like chemotaxis protein/GAF domain-containing protein